MATQNFCHLRLNNLDSDNNSTVIYPVNTTEDVLLQSGNTSLPKNLSTLDQLVDKFGLMAFVNKIAISDLDETLSKTISDLSKNVDDLMYVPITIDSFVNDIKIMPLGASVSTIKFDWTTNKVPQTLTLSGTNLNEELEPSLNTKTVTVAISYTDDCQFKLIAVDERGETVEKMTSINFMNYIYYGVSSEENLSDPNDLENKFLSDSKSKTFTITSNDTEYIYYAIPTRLGTPTFSVGGFEGGFKEIASSIEITNTSGYMETYNIWRSVNEGLGQITVTVG